MLSLTVQGWASPAVGNISCLMATTSGYVCCTLAATCCAWPQKTCCAYAGPDKSCNAQYAMHDALQPAAAWGQQLLRASSCAHTHAACIPMRGTLQHAAPYSPSQHGTICETQEKLREQHTFDKEPLAMHNVAQIHDGLNNCQDMHNIQHAPELNQSRYRSDH
jgi:hypothetical protein